MQRRLADPILPRVQTQQTGGEGRLAPRIPDYVYVERWYLWKCAPPRKLIQQLDPCGRPPTAPSPNLHC
jgi:hypothetical protein